MRRYPYIGPNDLARTADATDTLPFRKQVQTAHDVWGWIQETRQSLAADRTVTATFIVAVNDVLWIADRHSEHCHCARGQDVLAAGEMTFAVQKDRVAVVEMTNQSTGYCPEPDSPWAGLAALTKTDLPYPPDWTVAFLFRYCALCDIINVIKEGCFECGVCSESLPALWNFEKPP